MRKLLFLLVMHVFIDVTNAESACPGYNRYMMEAGPPAANASITLYEELNIEYQYGNSRCYKTCSRLRTCTYFIAQAYAGGYCYYGLEEGDNSGLSVSIFVLTNEDMYVKQDLDACDHAKCENEGTCVDERFTYSCVCPNHTIGRHCEEVDLSVLVSSSMQFNGNLNSYVLDTQLMLNNPGYKHTYEITFEFKTTTPSGIISFIGGHSNGNDYSAIFIHNGYVTHSVTNADVDRITARTSLRYNNGFWHTAKARKQASYVEVEVDQNDTANASGTGTAVNQNGDWYFGGLKTAAVVSEVEEHLQLGAGNVVGFNGCLRNLKISGSFIDANSEVSNIQHCG